MPDSNQHSMGELRADVQRERDRRHWTIDQQRKVHGDDWPAGVARVQKEADDAVDSLFEQFEACRAEAEEIITLRDASVAKRTVWLTRWTEGGWSADLGRAVTNPASEPRCTCRNFGPYEYREVDPACAVHYQESSRHE